MMGVINLKKKKNNLQFCHFVLQLEKNRNGTEKSPRQKSMNGRKKVPLHSELDGGWMKTGLASSSPPPPPPPRSPFSSPPPVPVRIRTFLCVKEWECVRRRCLLVHGRRVAAAAAVDAGSVGGVAQFGTQESRYKSVPTLGSRILKLPQKPSAKVQTNSWSSCVYKAQLKNTEGENSAIRK